MIVKSIDHVVKSAMNRIDNYDTGLYERMVNIACEQYAEFGFYHVPRIAVKYLEIPPSLIVPFPPDMEDYTKIGYIVGGNIRTLTINESMAAPRLSACLNDQNVASGSSPLNSGFFFVDHIRNGRMVTGSFAGGGGLNRSYYNVDKEKRIMWLSHDLPASELVVEYTSNGTSDGPDTTVMSVAVTPLRNYLVWQHFENKSGVSISEKRNKERQYNESVEAMRFKANSFTMSEYLDSCYAEYKQTPKR